MTDQEAPLLFERSRGQVMKFVPTMLLACALFLGSSLVGGAIDVPDWLVEIGAVLIGLLGYAVMARSFRCPACGSNLLIHAQFLEPIGNWIEKALAYRACPKCGFHRLRH
jgi:DNA-directed RNA polymerase subunit RPC12/RpoP